MRISDWSSDVCSSDLADAARARIDAAARIAFAPSGRDDAVLQLYTSGTTGNPKGAVLTNTNLFGLRKHSADLDMPYTKWEDDEAVLVAMPCAHIGGTGLGIMALAAGLDRKSTRLKSSH